MCLSVMVSPHHHHHHHKKQQKQQQQPLAIRKESPFDVLGIALVVEERGKGSRLVFRYPVTASTIPHSSGASSDSREDLFFNLPPIVMAKIFRPKRPMCGQPLTIKVERTMFCCRAVLFSDDDDSSKKASNLVRFCVIVAVAPSTSTSAVPIAGWFDSEQPQSLLETKSVSFRSVTRPIHISLARLCRVLEREENRCDYLSIQSSHLRKLRSNYGLSDTSTATKNIQRESASSKVAAPQNTSSDVPGRHRRMGSGISSVVGSLSGATPDGGNLSGDLGISESDLQKTAILQQQELEQEAVEAMLAAQHPLQEDTNTHYHHRHHGNLARELAQVFHALSRNYDSSVLTPTSLLSGRDGIVYINRHVAVPIEAVSGDSAVLSSVPKNNIGKMVLDYQPNVRPYHTLLFPHASPREFMETLSSLYPSIYSPQRLQQLLLMANPRKSLTDIAIDAALPLPIALELTRHLVSHGICIISPVLSGSSRFTCRHDAMPRMKELSLDFIHNFGPGLSIFMAVSALTVDSIPLRQVLSHVSSPRNDDRDNEDNTLRRVLGERIASALRQPCLPPGLVFDKGSAQRSGYGDFSVAGDVHCDDQSTVPREDIEEVIHSMTVWLRSHLIIAEMKDYLVSIRTRLSSIPSDTSEGSGASEPDGDRMKNQPLINVRNPEETLYQELLGTDCLNGHISTLALCWQHGLDSQQLHRFQVWGVRTNRIRVVSRIPTSTDDWNAA